MENAAASPVFATVFIASDHAGVERKAELVHHLLRHGINVQDLGPADTQSVDYPDYAHAVSVKVLATPNAAGILLCGSGIGMSIAANRHAGIRAALVHDAATAALTRQHNHANVLCLAARREDLTTHIACVDAFLATPFDGGRHEARLAKIEKL